MQKPSCNESEAMRQAGMTISAYMNVAIEIIDERFGNGYARASPNLIGDLVKAQTMDFNSTSQSSALYDIAQAIEGLSNEVHTLSDNLTKNR